MRVFITGGTGLIGGGLVRRLRESGREPVVLSRRAGARVDGAEVVAGDPTQPGPWQEVAAECDAVVNLAGENLFNRRWSAEFKNLLRDSRIKSTENCVAALTRHPMRPDGSPKTLVNGSAIGYYGPRGDEPIDESAPPGSDFLASLCVDWELAARPAERAGARLVLCRTGVVLDRDSGPLAKMRLPFKLGLGGPVGSGRQFMSWIHRDDIVGLIAFALESPRARGPMNGTAPYPVMNKEFGKAFGRALGRPAFMWTPGFALRLGLGQVAEIITTGQNVLPRKAHEWGYTFKFPRLDAALADLFKPVGSRE